MYPLFRPGAPPHTTVRWFWKHLYLGSVGVLGYPSSPRNTLRRVPCAGAAYRPARRLALTQPRPFPPSICTSPFSAYPAAAPGTEIRMRASPAAGTHMARAGILLASLPAASNSPVSLSMGCTSVYQCIHSAVQRLGHGAGLRLHHAQTAAGEIRAGGGLYADHGVSPHLVFGQDIFIDKTQLI